MAHWIRCVLNDATNNLLVKLHFPLSNDAKQNDLLDTSTLSMEDFDFSFSSRITNDYFNYLLKYICSNIYESFHTTIEVL